MHSLIPYQIYSHWRPEIWLSMYQASRKERGGCHRGTRFRYGTTRSIRNGRGDARALYLNKVQQIKPRETPTLTSATSWASLPPPPELFRSSSLFHPGTHLTILCRRGTLIPADWCTLSLSLTHTHIHTDRHHQGLDLIDRIGSSTACDMGGVCTRPHTCLACMPERSVGMMRH